MQNAHAENGTNKAGELLGLTREEEVFVALLRTGDAMVRSTESILREADVLHTQYNVLRILRRAPEGLPCTDVSKQMISRDPDMTRLLDRMEKRGLIVRERSKSDRRVVLAHITDAGLQILAKLDQPIREVHRKNLAHLGEARLNELMAILAAIRENVG